VFAGLFYEVQLSKGGMELSFQGYNHKLHILVTKALQELRNLADQGGSSGAGDSVVSQVYTRIFC
jgi:secreted Zn-dependent insulinase-like peptidase